ncbi:zf-HC2 domain-containing protein [Mesobacillus subterraneus]|uniref:zf-HC2 domain-containing protein n=1 Tax=Mesobacillus subterraneus TaxID=285983 RepID=UPI002040ED07|nr:zf-HC2 domain-containing protein [Mesobacillus subterraneus]MCM3666202.1 zf-HC2 domain-containing protein [Mesobacillus subterraneus]MCM3685200.1 zf-HC2 domain-containing protein [Mesobacillus subterraneus]
MKIEHDIVQDLYPLYIDSDLSPSVKIAVDEHLQACQECRRFYETGEKTANISKIDEPKVSKSLDEKIILRMKLNRLRLISIMLAAILFSMIFTDYVNEREQLFMATDGYYDALGIIQPMFDDVKNKDQVSLEPLQQEIHRFSKYNISLNDNLNFIEEYNKNSTEHHLSLNTQRLNAMLEVMKIRYDQGRWTETDEAAFQAVKDYFIGQEEVVSVEYNKTHHGYSSYLHFLNVKEMDQFYEKVNLLTYSYTRYHKLPNQIKALHESELKKRITNVLGFEEDDIELEKESPVNALYVYRFENKSGYGGTIDAINGQILAYSGDTGPLSNAPVISQKAAEKKANFYLEKIYGKEINFEVVSLGFNYNSYSDDPRHKVYSFKAVPMVQGYSLYTPLETETILHLNARNGKLESYDHNRHIPSFEQYGQIELSASVDKTKQPVIIYSALTGKFELVYMEPDLEYFDEDKFTSVKSGIEEKIYHNFY